MESEHTAKTLQIALGSYDRKELRVEKNYLQEQSPALECTCFQNGGRLLEQLRQGRQFDVVILCSQLGRYERAGVFNEYPQHGSQTECCSV